MTAEEKVKEKWPDAYLATWWKTNQCSVMVGQRALSKVFFDPYFAWQDAASRLEQP